MESSATVFPPPRYSTTVQCTVPYCPVLYSLTWLCFPKSPLSLMWPAGFGSSFLLR